MTVGILVDGQAEYRSLPLVVNKLETGERILPPIYCDIQPFANPYQIAHVASKRIPILVARGASKLIVLMDKESRTECTSEIVRAVERALISHFPRLQVSVVLKVSTFENWLVADPQAVDRVRSLFPKAAYIQKAVVPNRADNIRALELLTRCSKDGSYHKVNGAKAICEKMDPERAAMNSRSFRRFLRVLNHPRYLSQSKLPPHTVSS